jgi:periplasmic protein TonB
MIRQQDLAQWLIQRAARSAPPLLAERLEEEWLADLAARQGFIARLRFGVGCCWATRVIAYEHCAAAVSAAAASSTGSKTMSAYVRQTDTFVSQRTLTFLIIIGLHVAIIYAFANGMVHGVIRVFTDRVVVVRVTDPPPHPAPPLPPPVIQQPTLTSKLDPVEKLKVEIAEDPVPVNVDPNLDRIIAEQGPPAPPVHVVKRVLGGLGTGFPNTDDFYPPQEIRNHREGAPIVRTCVDEKGRLNAAPTLVQSSGTAGLDEGALRLAKAGSGHYRPTTEDGQPVVSCYDFRVVFHIRD